MGRDLRLEWGGVWRPLHTCFVLAGVFKKSLKLSIETFLLLATPELSLTRMCGSGEGDRS